MKNTATVADVGLPAKEAPRRRKWPVEVSIVLVLIGMALIFELLGWSLRGQSFLGNPGRLLIIILQVSTIGLLAVGVTQVIITAGVDLSSGSVLALSAMVAASLAQSGDYARAVFPSLTDMPAVVPVLAALAVGAAAGLVNGALITYGRLPAFIATLGMMVTARGLARYYTKGQPISLLTDQYTWIGSGANPVLQQLEDPGNATASVNDCFKPVSRFWDRITRPEQLLVSLPRAMAALTDPADCGPATLCLCQDVQAEACDYPETFFAPRLHRLRRPGADPAELADVTDLLRGAERPLIVAGGGVLYSGAAEVLQGFAATHRIPVAETQAGKSAMPWDHPQAVGSIGVTGSSAANALAGEADLVLAVGTRLQDFTTGSRAVLPGRARLVQLNVAGFDAHKHGAVPLVGDARRTLEELGTALEGYAAPPTWQRRAAGLVEGWNAAVDAATAPGNLELPTDAQVLGAVNQAAGPGGTVVCAAGGLPGELHKLWRSAEPGGYHLEYGFSCMGYEIAGGLGVKLARPERDVFVMVGDGSYLMLNSELHTLVMLGRKLIVTVLDNRGYGCINRLQQACGGAPFNNLLADVDGRANETWVDFAAHARSLGAQAEAVDGIAGLQAALEREKAADRTYVVVIQTDPGPTTEAGGAWWDVAVPEVSPRGEVQEARAAYLRARAAQAMG